MSFGEQLRKRREELGISRAELADRLGISRSAVGNYETGVSAPKEEVLLRLFDALGVDPNYLYRDAYRAGGGIRSDEEQALLEGYRRLSLAGRQTVHTMVRALEDLQQESERLQPRQDPRTIPCMPVPPPPGMPPRCSTRTMRPYLLPARCPGERSWRCGSRGIPWSRISTTAAWCM